MITPPALTDSGRSLLFRAIAGEEITFTRFKAGNGTAPAANDLGNPLISFGITASSTPEEGYISLTGSFDSDDVSAAFRWTELGVFCEDENGDEYMYAYANEGSDAGMVTPTGTNALTEQRVTVIIAIGNAEHVTARISASALYASKDDFDDHVAASNPHGTTKSDIGLGNVPNVNTNNQTPTYTEADTLTALTSGEKLSVAFGKLKKAVGALISHIADKANPHEVTLAQVGGAAAVHQHAASDINRGVLSVARGGTGLGAVTSGTYLMGTSSNVLAARTANQVREHLGTPRMVTGSYVGSGTFGPSNPTSLTFDFVPKFVIIKADAASYAFGEGMFITGTAATNTVSGNGASIVSLTWSANGLSWYGTENAGWQLNLSGVTYRYAAFG